MTNPRPMEREYNAISLTQIGFEQRKQNVKHCVLLFCWRGESLVYRAVTEGHGFKSRRELSFFRRSWQEKKFPPFLVWLFFRLKRTEKTYFWSLFNTVDVQGFIHYLTWIDWSWASICKACVCNRTVSVFHMTCVIAAFLTRTEANRCANAVATEAAVISCALITIIAWQCIVICPACLVANMTFLKKHIDVYLTKFAKTWLKKFQVHFNNLTSK